MPRYDFACPACGTFEAVAGHDDGVLECACGRQARRQAVYSQSVIFRGGGFTKSVIPPSSEGAYVEQEMSRELTKRGWDEDRAISELRANVIENADGSRSVNTKAMTKEA